MNNIEYTYAVSGDTSERFKLMEFVYNNSNSFILNTFGYLWSDRDWWDKFPVLYAHDHENILGIHAFTTNTKSWGTLKTYYIVVDKKLKGKGIGKHLILKALSDNEYRVDNYFVNSSADSEGVEFFKKLITPKYTTVMNEFGKMDYVFENKITDILNENYKGNCIKQSN